MSDTTTDAAPAGGKPAQTSGFEAHVGWIVEMLLRQPMTGRGGRLLTAEWADNRRRDVMFAACAELVREDTTGQALRDYARLFTAETLFGRRSLSAVAALLPGPPVAASRIAWLRQSASGRMWPRGDNPPGSAAASNRPPRARR